MELKKNDTWQSPEYETKVDYNPNDALFGKLDTDEPYMIANVSGGVKKTGGEKTAAILLVAALIIGAVVYVLMYMKVHKYDGRYEINGAIIFGTEYSLEVVEQISEYKIEAVLEVKGKRCDISLCYGDVDIDGAALMEWKGDNFTLFAKSSEDTVKGRYDKERDAIIISNDGIELLFENVD